MSQIRVDAMFSLINPELNLSPRFYIYHTRIYIWITRGTISPYVVCLPPMHSLVSYYFQKTPFGDGMKETLTGANNDLACLQTSSFHSMLFAKLVKQNQIPSVNELSNQKSSQKLKWKNHVFLYCNLWGNFFTVCSYPSLKYKTIKKDSIYVCVQSRSLKSSNRDVIIA